MFTHVHRSLCNKSLKIAVSQSRVSFSNASSHGDVWLTIAVPIKNDHFIETVFAPLECTFACVVCCCFCTGRLYQSSLSVAHFGAFLASIYWHLKKVAALSTECLHVSSDNSDFLRRIWRNKVLFRKLWTALESFKQAWGWEESSVMDAPLVM